MSPLTFLVFIAWQPLLWLMDRGPKGKHFFGWVYLAMVIWNTCTTWWVWNASGPGTIGAILANSLLMCLPWLGALFVQKKRGLFAGQIALLLFWLSFEYFHLQDWGLSWPWLTLGNVFAAKTEWIQWYEYTGTSGGGLWIVVVNLLIFHMTRSFLARKKPVATSIALVLVLVIPWYISLKLQPPGETGEDKLMNRNIVIVQPNIDPYEKVETGTLEAQLRKLIRISDEAIDTNTTLVVWPETAVYLEGGIEESNMKANFLLAPFWDFLHRHPKMNLLSGMESFHMYRGDHPDDARNIPGTNSWFETYNAAVLFDSSGARSIYHKSKLVPGVETLPFFLHFLDSWFEKLGGTTSGYTGQDDRTVFATTDSLYHIAPVICYESIYGEFMTGYARNGADIIAIITNDGWWGNTPGYAQHLNYARMRCIETRRWLVRSANTGVSALIDDAGNIHETRPYNETGFIKTYVPPQKSMTFYTQHGDVLSKIILIATLLFVLWFSWGLIQKKQRHA